MFAAASLAAFVSSVVSAVNGSKSGWLSRRSLPFVPRVRRFLHIVLCFSPVGDTFRVRARKFPALINNTTIDWFHPWPRDALVSVAQRFLEETGEVRDA